MIEEEGWATELDYFTDRRDKLLAGLERAGRDAAAFSFAAQVATGRTKHERQAALDKARDAVRRGATHVILGMPASLGAAGVDTVASEVAEPLRESIA
jgi:hypothetical protein